MKYAGVAYSNRLIFPEHLESFQEPVECVLKLSLLCLQEFYKCCIILEVNCCNLKQKIHMSISDLQTYLMHMHQTFSLLYLTFINEDFQHFVWMFSRCLLLICYVCEKVSIAYSWHKCFNSRECSKLVFALLNNNKKSYATWYRHAYFLGTCLTSFKWKRLFELWDKVKYSGQRRRQLFFLKSRSAKNNKQYLLEH